MSSGTEKSSTTKPRTPDSSRGVQHGLDPRLRALRVAQARYVRNALLANQSELRALRQARSGSEREIWAIREAQLASVRQLETLRKARSNALYQALGRRKAFLLGLGSVLEAFPRAPRAKVPPPVNPSLSVSRDLHRALAALARGIERWRRDRGDGKGEGEEAAHVGTLEAAQ